MKIWSIHVCMYMHGYSRAEKREKSRGLRFGSGADDNHNYMQWRGGESEQQLHNYVSHAHTHVNHDLLISMAIITTTVPPRISLSCKNKEHAPLTHKIYFYAEDILASKLTLNCCHQALRANLLDVLLKWVALSASSSEKNWTANQTYNILVGVFQYWTCKRYIPDFSSRSVSFSPLSSTFEMLSFIIPITPWTCFCTLHTHTHTFNFGRFGAYIHTLVGAMCICVCCKSHCFIFSLPWCVVAGGRLVLEEWWGPFGVMLMKLQEQRTNHNRWWQSYSGDNHLHFFFFLVRRVKSQQMYLHNTRVESKIRTCSYIVTL